MNWITTNLRLPEDLYMELKLKAARERRSVAAVIREKLSEEKKTNNTKVKRLLAMQQKISKKIAKENPGINFAEGLIKMRYEQ
ncbi:MAG: hypothetical protein A2868_00230 [Candidatus Levybacteria bacterium RIFCSPHIGHO2_01_FULL_40_15b]|nr:MAG: hypothetical protein A2868_00230 [Candidatus Levybacteria bacterium RIFCSPHIGHO2_01_FULL_40_15b]